MKSGQIEALSNFAANRSEFGAFRNIPVSPNLPKYSEMHQEADGGYGWDRTTDLTIMSRALSPAELRSPSQGGEPYRKPWRGRNATKPLDPVRSRDR